MSYPYGQYSGENFSNPTTPLTISTTWETMENEEQQHEQQHNVHQHQPESPTEPRTHPPQQHQTIHLEDPPQLPITVGSQARPYDENPVLLHHVIQRTERTRESLRESEARVPHGLDTRTGIASTSGPVRHARSSHPQLPYRRPPSATSVAPPQRQLPLVRFASVQPISRHTSSSAVHSPTVPSPAMASPASATSRLASFGSGIGSPIDTPLAQSLRHELRNAYILRADSHYDVENQRLTVMLEVPGVSKADVRVTLSTSSWSRVKELTVSGVSRPVFPPPSRADVFEGRPELRIRERKFGDFKRRFAVPPETNPQDVEATMEDGVLTIKILCGWPVDPDPQDIPIQ